MALSTPEVTDKLANEIKRHRLKLGMTKTGLAHAIGCGFDAVYNWERGKHLPNVKMLTKLAKVLHVTEMELLYPH